MSNDPYRLAKHLRIAVASVMSISRSSQPLLLDGDDDLLGAAVIEQRLKRLLGVLLGKDANPRPVFFATKFVQEGAQRGISPPASEGSHEVDVDGVCQRIDTLARQVASGGVCLRP